MSPLHRLLAVGTAAGALLAGCAHSPVGPDYVAPAPLSAAQATSAGPFQSGSGAAADTALPPNWWQLYQDPRLDALVAQAFEHNTDLRQAVANFERDQALQAEVRGSQKPTVGLSGGPGFGHVSGLTLVQRDYEPPSRFTYSAATTLSYQFDLFGQLHRAIEAAEAGSGAAQAAVDLVRVNVAGSTARAYAQVCASGLRLRSTRESVRLQEEAVQLAQRLQQAGKVGEIDTARARAQLELLRASLPPLQALRQNALYRLATLTGEAPRDFPPEVAACDQPPRVAGLLPVGDGAALLRRRPDVRQAERSLAAATARIGVATAELYPKVVLGLSAGSAGFLNKFGNRESLSYSLGPLISWTLPSTGVAQARIAQAESGTRMAAAHFDGTVLRALREVETALDAYARELDRHAALAAARDQSATVARQARQLYVTGKTAQLDALDAMRTLAASEAALAESAAQLADDQCAVFMVLGGGWETGAVVAKAAP
ncbi:efflux transporter outer membrane subunit [Variovorax sp. PAMC26660]|uniref:efflux transporter outer membrane subunit n=1 Tax=Variovorax sp. PAMC26660 TaxID=2762322 RepID=UPI00164D1BFF|nr:TolC family protein [Variovorax sp. PAMC26660]QNK69270.1 TolC family protein [Variovorax sp. PAMC26660]